MKKQMLAMSLSAVMALMMAAPASAAAWKVDSEGRWRYDVLGRGTEESYMKSQWAWIDGDHNGLAQCYYLDENGYLAQNTVIDGYTVDQNGMWTVDGVVQERAVGNTSSSSMEISANETLRELAAPAELNYGSAGGGADVNGGLHWDNAVILNGSVSHAASAVYDLSGNQTKMSLTFAPVAGQEGNATSGRISVTGLTSGKSLYISEKLTTSAPAVTITFACPREKQVRIAVLRGFDFALKSVAAVEPVVAQPAAPDPNAAAAAPAAQTETAAAAETAPAAETAAAAAAVPETSPVRAD